jgi:hypothetical protein
MEEVVVLEGKDLRRKLHLGEVNLVINGWRKLSNYLLYSFHSSPNIVDVFNEEKCRQNLQHASR